MNDYDLNYNDILTVCDGFHYGVNCEAPCDCLVGADYCDNVAGCICLSGWTGSQCGEDKNECDAEVSLCSGRAWSFLPFVEDAFSII